MQEIKAGTFWINDPLTDNDAAPFGGMRKSGMGRELGEEGLDAFRETKHVHLDFVPERKTFWFPYAQRRGEIPGEPDRRFGTGSPWSAARARWGGSPSATSSKPRRRTSTSWSADRDADQAARLFAGSSRPFEIVEVDATRPRRVAQALGGSRRARQRLPPQFEPAGHGRRARCWELTTAISAGCSTSPDGS